MPATLIRFVTGFQSLTSRIFSNSPLLKKVWIRRPSVPRDIAVETTHDIKLYSSYYRTHRMDSVDEAQIPNLYKDKFQFPPNATHLYLDDVFVSKVDLISFPLQLTHLVVGSYCYTWDDDEVLSQSLTHLMFAGSPQYPQYRILDDIEEPITKLQNLIFLNIPDPMYRRKLRSFPPHLQELRLTVDDDEVDKKPNIRVWRECKPPSLLVLTIVTLHSGSVRKTFYL